MSTHLLCVRVKISVFLNLHFWFYMICRLEVFLSCSICPRSFIMLGGIFFNNCWLFRPGHVRKFPLLINFSKVLGVGLKQHPWRYSISSVFILSFVMIAISRCLTGVYIGMPYKPSILFLCHFKISFLPLRILISFLSDMEIHSSSHSWPKDINEELCNPSKCAPFLHGRLDCLLGGCPLFLLHSSSHCLENNCWPIPVVSYICKYCHVFILRVIIWRTTVILCKYFCVLRWVYNRSI